MNRNDTLNSEFVPYEIALALKELGFDEDCFGFFWVTENHTSFLHIEFMIGKMNRLNKLNILRPTFSQAFRWFREKYNLLLDVVIFYDENQLPLTYKNLQKPKGYFVWDYYDENFNVWKATIFNTYEEAELECLKQLIKIVKKKIK